MLEEWFDLPGSFGPLCRRRIVRGIKNIFEPPVGLGKTLIRAESLGDHKRRVKEEFPVVDRISALVGKVENVGWTSEALLIRIHSENVENDVVVWPVD